MREANKENCKTVLRKAAKLAEMSDVEIKNNVKFEGMKQGTKIRVLRSEIGEKCTQVAFPAKMVDFYVGQGSFGTISMYQELISGKALSIKATHSLDGFRSEVRDDLLACQGVRKSIAHRVLDDTIAVYRGEGTMDDDITIECYDF